MKAAKRQKTTIKSESAIYYENALSNIYKEIRDKKVERAEVLEMINLSYQDYEYRHKTFWELVFKSIFAIVILMVMPYILLVDNHLNKILFVFPLISILLSIFSLIVLKAEGVRMSAMRMRMNILISGLSKCYAEPPISIFTYSKVFEYFNKKRIVNVVLALYFALIAGALIEICLILFKQFI